MLSHKQVWNAIDTIAERYGYSASGLAKKSGLDPTSFNPSKRAGPDGRPPLPTRESIWFSRTRTLPTRRSSRDARPRSIAPPRSFNVGRFAAFAFQSQRHFTVCWSRRRASLFGRPCIAPLFLLPPCRSLPTVPQRSTRTIPIKPVSFSLVSSRNRSSSLTRSGTYTATAPGRFWRLALVAN